MKPKKTAKRVFFQVLRFLHIYFMKLKIGVDGNEELRLQDLRGEANFTLYCEIPERKRNRDWWPREMFEGFVLKLVADLPWEQNLW